MNMKIEPIKISIDNTRRFLDVALLLDRDDFLEDVISKRKELGLQKIIPRKILQATWDKVNNKATNDLLKGIHKKNKTFKHGLKAYEVRIISPFDKAAVDLATKYKKGREFFDAIKYAIVSGEVNEEDTKTIYKKDEVVVYQHFNDNVYAVLPVPIGLENDYIKSSLKLDESEIAIIINPTTTREDLNSFYDFFEKNYRKKTDGIWHLDDTYTNIKRDREWYWMKKSGLSYGQIQKKYEKSGLAITRDGVIKAIQQYSRLLNRNLKYE